MLARKPRYITKIRRAIGLYCLIAVGIVGSFQISVPTPVQSKQSINDPESPLPLPKTADLFQNPPNPADFSSFNASEVCKREFNAPMGFKKNVTIDAPPTYNATSVDVTFLVYNATLNASTIVDNPGTNNIDKNALAQSFEVTSNSSLSDVSLYFYGTKSQTLTLEIRSPNTNGFPNGTIINSTSWTFTAGWSMFTYATPIYLEQGRYFVYLSQSGTHPNHRAWVYNSINLSPTYYDANDGYGWKDAPFDLTLKVSLSSTLNPRDPSVDMKLNNQPVQNLGGGFGRVNVTKVYSGSQVNFTVLNSTPILYSYALNATYFRNVNASNIQVSFDQLRPNWIVTIPFNDPKTPYTGYKANISGFQNGYSFPQVFNGSVGVYCNYTHFSEGYVEITDEATHLTFDSDNYLTGIECPSEIYAGTSVNINVSFLASGNITLEIYTDGGRVYQDSKLGTETVSFQWDISSGSPSGDYSIQVYYMGFNQAGANQTHVTVKKEAYLSVGGISVPALGNVTLQSHFIDISNNPIQGADVQFNIWGITGIMNYASSSGNYTSNLNLDANALVPGTYDLSVTAITAGYRPRTGMATLQVTPRAVNLSLNPSARLVHPGEVLHFTVNAQEAASGSFLLRPVNLILRVYPVGGNAARDAIMVHTFTGVSLEDEFAWTVPTGVDFGTYDVAVEVSNPYYAAESYVISSGLTIDPPLNYLLYVGIIAGIVIISSGVYVQRKKSLTRASVKGLMILQKKGASVKERISPSFSNKDPLLVSGAVIGMISLMREITGGGLRSIVVEGGYIQFARGSSFWAIKLLRRNPKWIRGTIYKMIADIEARFGKTIAQWQGKNIDDLDIGAIVKQHFGVTLEKAREPNYEELSPPPTGSAP